MKKQKIILGISISLAIIVTTTIIATPLSIILDNEKKMRENTIEKASLNNTKRQILLEEFKTTKSFEEFKTQVENMKNQDWKLNIILINGNNDKIDDANDLIDHVNIDARNANNSWFIDFRITYKEDKDLNLTSEANKFSSEYKPEILKVLF